MKKKKVVKHQLFIYLFIVEVKNQGLVVLYTCGEKKKNWGVTIIHEEVSLYTSISGTFIFLHLAMYANKIGLVNIGKVKWIVLHFFLYKMDSI